MRARRLPSGGCSGEAASDNRRDGTAIPDDSEPAPIITFQNATVRFGARWLLRKTNWTIRRGEQWAVVGPNGSGKSTLMRAVMGDAPVVQGRISRNPAIAQPGRIALVSFENARLLLDRDREGDAARHFSGRPDEVATVREILADVRCSEAENAERYESPFFSDLFVDLIERPIRNLSNGELRKVLILRSLLSKPELLILDEPFDGLDIASRKALSDILHRLMAEGQQIILVSHRIEEIPPNFDNIIRLKDGAVEEVGRRDEMLARYFTPDTGERRDISIPIKTVGRRRSVNGTPLIQMRGLTVRYGDRVVLCGLDWTVRGGENWAVSGPNGSGKTTLLRMIAGDHSQAYANEIYLFGRRRGSGESIWEIKHRIGMVSPESQINYRKPIPAMEVILSGFFDSVGLYRRATPEQYAAARRAMNRLGLEDLAGHRFDRLSYGQQRMVLIARAVVKSPELLILDEPCQGLDTENRRKVLALVDVVGNRTDTQIIFVTHQPDEIPPCVDRHLQL